MAIGWGRIALGACAAVLSLYAIADAQGWGSPQRSQASPLAADQASPPAADNDNGTRPAARATCRLPDSFPMPEAEPPRAGQVRRTPVTRYTLALSWSPGHCARNRQDADGAMQCSGEAGSFGFVLHGLWPETNGRNWPQYCAPTRVIARETLRQHLCMTPSPQLLQHEWAKHGSCMARTPEAYFERAAELYHRVQMPDMRAFAHRRDATAGDLRAAFMTSNPGLARSAIQVNVTGNGWLSEVHLCLDRRFRYAACPAWQQGAADNASVRVEPQR